MDRKNFLKNGFLKLGAMVALPSVAVCSDDDSAAPAANGGNNDSDNCTVSPAETIGPFPIRTPAQYVRANIIGDRTGIPLLITITIQDKSNGCIPLEGVWVDIWMCDKDGNYSQYGGSPLQAVNYSNQNFLRGRQTTDANGRVSYISIFPGWYPARAPHIHVQVLKTDGTSLLVTEIAFPVSVYSEVYATNGYNGAPDRSNSQDHIFSNSLSENMADSVTGNITDGYTLLKTITVE
jgi:protocatechuate 3,4-dioxygenase beta subunit